MRRKLLFILLFLVAATACIWWFCRSPMKVRDVETTQESGISNTALSAPSNSVKPRIDEIASSAVNLYRGAKRELQVHEATESGKDEWRSPIKFYGKIIDESNAAVSGARIDFSCNDLSPTGTSFYNTTSDGEGLFSISGISGKLLTVSVLKNGYIASKRDNGSFYYSGQNVNFTPDVANPVVFHLRKKGDPAQLIHVQAALGGGKGFRIPKDGTPITISLVTGLIASKGTGDLQVECWTGDEQKKRGQKYDWKCRITVPNGGILGYAEEFPFTAPLEGYQPSDEISMLASAGKDWGRSARRNYFAKLANGNYARINFEMIAGGNHFFTVESFLNPSGSRNLE
jgi:hypothetical protein